MHYKVTNPIMCTNKEAQDVLDFMYAQIEERGYVTVEQVYDKVWMLENYRGKMDYAYGWTNLKILSVKYNEYEGGFEVRLPVPVVL